MNFVSTLRQIQKAEKLTGRQLLNRLAARSHNAAGLPLHEYDGDDITPLVRRMTEAERTEFGIGPGLAAAALEEPAVLRSAKQVKQPDPVYVIRVHIICCADDDGGNAFADPQQVTQWIDGALEEANAIYAARGAGIKLIYIPGDIELIKDTHINQDFLIPPGTKLKSPEDKPPLSDDEIKQLGLPHEAARNALSANYPGRCVFLLCCGTNLSYDAAKKSWGVGPREGYAYSGETKEFVNFPSKWGQLHGPEVAHESGHFFHLWHTFNANARPVTLDEASQFIAGYVANHGGDISGGLDVFDADLGSGVKDTPPDPGPHFYGAVAGGDQYCLLNVTPKVTVNFGGGKKHTYTFDTDRGAVMSYFKGCSNFQQHFTADQIARARDAIRNGNRRRIVAAQLGDTKWPGLRYSALWNAGQGGCVWWPACSEEQLRKKTAELWDSMRLKQMTGFVLDGEVRYSCIWTPSTHAQVWWPNCSEKEFRDKTKELWGSMRPAQVHAFISGNEVRYSCIWNAGTHAQVWWPNCSEKEFRDKTGELWASMRPVQVQPFLCGGSARFSCLWDAGTEPVVWSPDCTEEKFREKTDEIWATMRPSYLAAYKLNGKFRFSALWRKGTAPQVWWPLCTEEQLRQQTGDTWSSMRPEHWMPAVF